MVDELCQKKITRIEMKTIPVFHDITVRISNMALTDTYPENVQLLDVKLVDSLGQNKQKEWSGKTKDIESLKSILEKQVKDGEEGYPFEKLVKMGRLEK
mgnify:CR=1 FL=1